MRLCRNRVERSSVNFQPGENIQHILLIKNKGNSQLTLQMNWFCESQLSTLQVWSPLQVSPRQSETHSFPESSIGSNAPEVMPQLVKVMSSSVVSQVEL